MEHQSVRRDQMKIFVMGIQLKQAKDAKKIQSFIAMFLQTEAIFVFPLVGYVTEITIVGETM
jgi:hypothetical protein